MHLLPISRTYLTRLNIISKKWFNFSKRASSNMALFVDKQLDLLEIEHLSEIEENNLETANLSLRVLQRKGICIPKLVINSLKTGLYDRSIATFSLRTIEKTFPFNILSSGDIVKLNQPDEEKISSEECNGIVTKVSENTISVAFDSLSFRDTLDMLNQHGKSVALIKVANKVTYERLKGAMKDLNNYTNGPAQHLIEVLFGDATPLSHKSGDVTLHSDALNKCQRDAVSFAMAQREVAIIHGPPGTGKTTTMIEIIAQLVRSGQKVLACAPSNVAVDNLLDKLSGLQVGIMKHGTNTTSHHRKLKLVRLGHPARILDPKLQELSLDALIFRSGAASIIRDVRADIEQIQVKLRHCPDQSRRHSLRQERKSLMAELRKREKKAINDIIFPADVVLATNVGAYPKGPLQNVKKDHFDVIVIDECGQALEAACWIPLLRARKCILAGDHLQLPPTIVSNEAAAEGLSVTLLERLIDLHGDQVVRMLTEQYRMHHLIMEWASKQMYDGKLTAHESVEGHLLRDLPGVENTEDTNLPMLLVDTAGCDMTEAESEESDSKANAGEAKIVYKHVLNLIEAGVEPDEIAVVSPYNLQVDLIRHAFHDKYPRLEVKSVDGFQGREKEAVVLSLVRSNAEGEVGFLSDKRRLNVAVTRARRHLAVICDSETVSRNAFIKTLLSHITEHGEVRSGFEYTNFSEKDDKTFDCFQSFNLISVLPQAREENKAKGKSTKPHKTDTSSKSIKIKKENYTNRAKSYKSSDQCLESNSTNTDLKDTYRTIILKYMKIFSANKYADHRKNFDSYLKEEDLSEALNLEIRRKDKTIVFPSSLTALERKVIHELCEELFVSHRSMGDGGDRRVLICFASEESSDVLEDASCAVAEISLKSTADEDDADPDTLEEFDKTQNKDSEETILQPLEDSESNLKEENSLASSSQDMADALYATCDRCGKTLPRSNLQLHSAHCDRMMRVQMRMEEKQEENRVPVGNTAKSDKKKNKKKKSKTTSKSLKEDNEDFDDLINEAISSNRTCRYSNCTASVTTIGQLCKICRRTFCLSHNLPEVHGCGERTRVNARRQISRDGILYAGSGLPDRKPAPEKRAMMKNKLSAKLKSMEGARKSSKDQK